MKASVSRNKDAMSIAIDGRADAPVISRSFRSLGNVVKSFYDRGFRFFNMFPSGITNLLGVPYSQFGEVWIGEGDYDWDALRHQADLFLENAPDGYISVMAQLDTRDWFLKEHPECADSYTQLIQTVGYSKWRESASRWLCALIDKMEEWFPDKVYGVFLMAGGTTEWYTKFANDSKYIGYYNGVPNELQTKIYREWQNDPTAVIPTKEKLHASVKYSLMNPAVQTEEQKYWHFYNDVVADAISYFAKVAKEHTNGRMLVGSFYGYLTGITLPYVRECNYLGIGKILDDKNIDVLFCPTSYTLRPANSTSGFRIPVDSITLHDKLYYMEIDCRTYLVQNNELAQRHSIDSTDFRTVEQVKNYICREAAMTVAHGQSYWWFDMFGGYYEDEPLMDIIETLKGVNRRVYEDGAPQVCEVAMMLDVNSMYVIGMDYLMAEPQIEQMTRSGVPWAEYSADDLFCENFPLDRIKVFVFANLEYPTDAMREMIEKLRKMGKTLVFMHAPGYVTDKGFSEGAMESLTGLKLTEIEGEEHCNVYMCEGDAAYNYRSRGTKGSLTERDYDLRSFGPFFTTFDEDVVVLGRYSNSGRPATFYKKNEYGGIDAFSAAAPVPYYVLRTLYREAGVFNYMDDPETLYLNGKFVCLNSYVGGKHKFYWPRVEEFEDVFTHERITFCPEGVDVEFTPEETRLFLPVK